MALVTVTMYRIVCDRCGACAQDDSDFYAWADDAQALDDASDADWLITDDGKHVPMIEMRRVAQGVKIEHSNLHADALNTYFHLSRTEQGVLMIEGPRQ